MLMINGVNIVTLFKLISISSSVTVTHKLQKLWYKI